MSSAPSPTDQELQIVDGTLPVGGPVASGGSLRHQAAEAWQYLGTKVHEQILREIAVRAGEELARWRAWLNMRAAERDCWLEVELADSLNGYGASVGPRRGLDRFGIRMELGGLRLLLMIASGLRVSEASSDPLASHRYVWDAARAIDRNGLEPGCLSHDHSPSGFETLLEAVVDAIVLMLLHEAGHALGGHFHWRADWRNDDPLRRSIETDADWAAGRLFVLGQREISGQQPTLHHVERFVRASTLNHVALRLKGGSRTKYHLPPTRTRAVIEGAHGGWKALGLDVEQFGKAAEALHFRLMGLLVVLDHDFPEDESALGGRLVRVDYTEFQAVTVPRIMQMRKDVFARRIGLLR